MAGPPYEIVPIGRVESSLTDVECAPKQGTQDAPAAWLVLESGMREAMRDLRIGDTIIVLTWLDRAPRDVLVVHPQDNTRNPERGVFSTRSAARPNPIGLHRVQITAIEGTRIQVRHMEAVDGTPIVDVKCVLDPHVEQ